MKKFFLILSCLLLSAGSGYAQKFALVDSEYILNNIPAYKTAQAQLDRESQAYQKEVEAKYAAVEKMYKAYQTERSVLTEQMRAKREEEIIKLETEAKELQKKYFGEEGEIFKKREALLTPIQDQVYEAIKAMANEEGYAVVFDTATAGNVIYANPKNDRSDAILQRLGYKNN